MKRRSFTKRLPEKQRRQSILDAAFAVLSSEGYSGMTTLRLAQRVGVAEPILYRHFSSKRSILRALLEEVIGRMTAAFRQLIRGETDPVAALRRICRAYPELAQRYGREFRIINESIFAAKDPDSRRALERHYNLYRAFIGNLIKQGQKTGALRRDIPAAVGAWHMVHCALGMLMMQEVRKSSRTSREFEWLAEATLSGLMNPGNAWPTKTTQ